LKKKWKLKKLKKAGLLRGMRRPCVEWKVASAGCPSLGYEQLIANSLVSLGLILACVPVHPENFPFLFGLILGLFIL